MSTTKEYQVILYTFSIEGELIKVDEKIPSFESELVYDLSCHPAVLGGVSRAYDVATLVQSIETVAGKVNKMSTLGMGGYNEVLSMELKNGDKLVVRIAFSHSGIEETARALNIPPHQWIQDKLEREVLIMNTVRCVAIPVPRATSLADNLVGKPWMLSEYVEGTSLDTIYALMSWESKIELLNKFASMHCALFDLPCPQKIGSIIERDNVAVAGCLIVISPVAPSAPFDDISSYISWLFADMRASKKMGDTPADKEASEHVLKRVEKILPSILKTSPCLQRFVLSHRDLRPPNILITSDVRSFAVIDWEFHAILPACLMAEYPTWIRYDGVLDPKFICTAPNTVHYWEETELAASELRAIYDKAVQKINPMYYKALKEGEALRSVLEWFRGDYVDPGLRKMDAWVSETFPWLAEVDQ